MVGNTALEYERELRIRKIYWEAIDIVIIHCGNEEGSWKRIWRDELRVKE